jgi:outer membrane receptor protein involved in Fe transport
MNGGNKNLSPEKSKNGTIGIMWEPIKNLTLSADWWTIRLTNQISILTDTDVLADPVTFAPTTTVTRPATWPPTVRSALTRSPAATWTCAPRTWAT